MGIIKKQVPRSGKSIKTQVSYSISDAQDTVHFDREGKKKQLMLMKQT